MNDTYNAVADGLRAGWTDAKSDDNETADGITWYRTVIAVAASIAAIDDAFDVSAFYGRVGAVDPDDMSRSRFDV